MAKVIVLDRDGVINEDSDAFIKSADEWGPVEGSLQAIRMLKEAGWKVAVATNQSGIRRGYYDRATLSAMHQKMQSMLTPYSVDWISFAPYLGEDRSPARKPGTGMLQSIEKALGCSLKGAPMVGDTLGDLKAALRQGMRPHLVRSGKGERTLSTRDPLLQSIPVHVNLLALVRHLLAEDNL